MHVKQKKGISTTEPVWKSFLCQVPNIQGKVLLNTVALNVWKWNCTGGAWPLLRKHYSFMCPLANARHTVRQNVKVYARKNARQDVRVCRIECQYMSLPISNIASQCQLLGCVLTSVGQMSKEASPVSVWNCCAMTSTFAVQWSLLLVWPQIFIKIMCLKGNFSPMIASMHGNEALKTHPMPQKKWNNNTRMSAWRLSNGFWGCTHLHWKFPTCFPFPV